MHYICSDIHGRWEKYQAMLEGIRLGQDDRLYILGDVIDRGPEGIRILQDVMKRDNVSFFLGNHELFLYRCVREAEDEDLHDLWMVNGGAPTEFVFARLDIKEQVAILAYLQSAYVAIPDLRVGDRHYYLVHAYPNPDFLDEPVRFIQLEGDPEKRYYDMVWHRSRNAEHDPQLTALSQMGREVVIGHTITTYFNGDSRQEDGRAKIYRGPCFTALDCGCAAFRDETACLGVLRLEDGAEFYY